MVSTSRSSGGGKSKAGGSIDTTGLTAIYTDVMADGKKLDSSAASITELGKILGVSRSHAFRFVKKAVAAGKLEECFKRVTLPDGKKRNVKAYRTKEAKK